MSDGVLLIGIKPSRSNQWMVESDGSPLLKDCLEEIIKHLLVFIAPNIIFTGQLEKDIRCEDEDGWAKHALPVDSRGITKCHSSQ